MAQAADELRGWRERRRVSQLELALRAGTTQRHVSFIESGRSAPGRGMVIRLAEPLELPISLARLLLHPRGMAPRIVNLDEWAWHIVDAVQREEVRNPSERRAALLADLEAWGPARAAGPDPIGVA